MLAILGLACIVIVRLAVASRDGWDGLVNSFP